MSLILSFTMGGWMHVSQDDVADCLLSRDYKDAPCVLVTDETIKQRNGGNAVRQRIPRQTNAPGCDDRDVSGA